MSGSGYVEELKELLKAERERERAECAKAVCRWCRDGEIPGPEGTHGVLICHASVIWVRGRKEQGGTDESTG